MYIIESILEDINISFTDFGKIKNKFPKNENGLELIPEFSSKEYEYFDEIDIEIKINFLKNFIINKNYEKLLKYMNELLDNYNFDNKENKENFIINLCCEKCLKIINIIYNITNDKISDVENETISKNNNINEIIPLDFYNLASSIKSNENIKQILEQINFTDYAITLIKFINKLNEKINSEENSNNTFEQNNLLQNSFTFLINLVFNNDKLSSELYSKIETKNNLENLIKSIFNTKN